MARDTKIHFATVYITLVSVLLGLALEDLVSIVRGVEQRDLFVWITSVFIVHIIMNAWIAYSATAISVALEPHPGDAVNVFLLSASHFALNSFIGAEPAVFFLATGVYSLLAAGTVYFNAVRASQDPEQHFEVSRFVGLIALNIAAGVAFLAIALLFSQDVLSPAAQVAFAAGLIPFASLWLLVYWRSWTASRQFAG